PGRGAPGRALRGAAGRAVAADVHAGPDAVVRGAVLVGVLRAHLAARRARGGGHLRRGVRGGSGADGEVRRVEPPARPVVGAVLAFRGRGLGPDVRHHLRDVRFAVREGVMSAERSLGALALALALVVTGVTGCKDPDRYRKEFHEPYKLAGGKTLDPVTLNHGFEAFMLYCYGCHGEKGDGHGPASLAMRPPPRNFQQGIFKFGGVAAGSLPVDDALDRTIRRGLNGTPMLQWDVPAVERKYLIAYIKTLSTKWQEEEPGAPIEITPDPWKDKEQEAIAR